MLIDLATGNCATGMFASSVQALPRSRAPRGHSSLRLAATLHVMRSYLSERMNTVPRHLRR